MRDRLVWSLTLRMMFITGIIRRAPAGGGQSQPPLRHRLNHAAAFPADGGQCGVSASLVQGILDEIENETDRAIETAVDGLSPGFPERIVSSVIEGLRRRLRLFAHATA